MALQEHGNADFGGSEAMRALIGERTCSRKLGQGKMQVWGAFALMLSPFMVLLARRRFM